MPGTAHTVFEGDITMKLQSAIMLYGSDQGAGFATAHDVSFEADGVPVLREGHPLTMENLNSLVATVAKGAETRRRFNGYLPENVLATGIGSIVWWLPAADRTVSFSCNDELIGKSASGKTPHPALVFGVNGRGWYVFALKENVRPKPDTNLWQAPYFNVWSSGAICQGSTQVPKGATTEQIEGWSNAFFASNFSHPNVHQTGKLVKYKGGPYRFWRDMLDGNFKKFPMRVLVDSGNTLDNFIAMVLNGREL